MLQQNTTKRLGYWLLLLQLTFEEDMAAALADQDLDRRRWQVLHALAIGVGTTPEIDAAFAPFLGPDDHHPMGNAQGLSGRHAGVYGGVAERWARR